MKHKFSLKTMAKVSYLISIAFMIAALLVNALPVSPVLAGNAGQGSGAIWTLTDGCGPPQNVNQYTTGDHVWINGSGFDPDTLYAWDITGKPGGASGDPNMPVAFGDYITDLTGAFCFDAYTIAADDWGEYQVKFGNKGDNYSVNPAENTPVPPAPALSIVKTATPATYDSVSDVISYSYVVTNTGDVDLTGVTVTDDKAAAVSCPSDTVTVGEAMTCTASYTIVQGDINAGSVTNTATADSNETDPITAQATVTYVPPENPALTLAKTALPTTYSAVGNVISYSYLVTNTGNVALTGVTVTDNKAAVSCPSDTVTVGGSMTCTASYTIVQGDINAGSVTNTATVDSNETDPITAQATVTYVPPETPAFTLAKTALPTTFSAVGNVISYSYLVTNTGNVTLTGVTVTDNKAAAVSCPSDTVAVGEAMTCTASYTIVQGDINAGSVTNTATADSNETDPITAQATVTYLPPETPAFTLAKTALPTKYSAVGNVISYSYLVTNTGNVALTGVTVTDNKAATVSCPKTTLAVGEAMTCTASYTIVQGDINAGSVTNTATADSNETDPITAQATVTYVPPENPALTLAKTALPTTYSAVGNVISYSYLVTNSGNTILTGPFTVSDDKAANESCPAKATLAPGASITCTASYTITQADLDTGSVTNKATASGGGATSNEATATVNSTQTPALNLTKSASPTTYDHVGQTISYSYEIKNIGNVTLSGPFTVSDDKATVTCPAGGLAPDATMTCTASYIITQADLNAGSVTNHATASGNDVTSNQATATVNATQAKALLLTKTADPLSYSAKDQTINYSYVIKNIGNVTLSGPFTVSDDKASVTCPAGGLAPSAMMTCTASYIITQADLDAGSVTNHATASGNGVTSNQATATVYAEQAKALLLTKTADPLSYSAMGQTISYSYVIKNTSNVTLTGPFTVADNKATVSCTQPGDGALSPNETMNCTAIYTITQADLNAGLVTNTATATGGGATSNKATATVYAIQTPGLTIKKSVTETSYTLVGDKLHYSYLVTNTGNVSLTGVGVTDDKTTVACPKNTLEPAEAMTCTAIYTVTNADISVENITNTAYATGHFGDKDVKSAPDSETVIRFLKLILSARCAADPKANDGWQVVNNNPYAVDIEYAIDGGVSGVGTVPANSTVIFDTPVGSGTGVMTLYVNGLPQNNAKAATGCIENPPPAPPENPVNPVIPLIPVTGPVPVAGPTGPAVLIPVTGLDMGMLGRTLPGTLFGLSFSFAGLGLVLSGFARRRED
jgi:uncharacterized repeat protein (TIGR01451 family)